MSVRDDRSFFAHGGRMVTHDELLETMRAWVADGRVRVKEIAATLDVASTRVSEMLGGRRRIQQREMPILAELFGLAQEPPSNVRKIKRIGLVPAGELRQALDTSTDFIEAAANLPKGVFALEVDGESMNRLAPFGADVIVDPNDKSLFGGDLYVIGDGSGAFTFKLFQQNPARLVPLSDDPSHKVIQLGTEPVEIIGRVVSVQLGSGTLRKLATQLSDS